MAYKLIKSPTNFTKSLKNPLDIPSISRLITTNKRVQDRSERKRVEPLEIVGQKHKFASKILCILEILKRQCEHIIPIRSLDHRRGKIDLPNTIMMSDFIRKFPKLFEIYTDQMGTTWVGLTTQGEELIEEEDRLIEENDEKALEHVTRLLMMSVDKILPLSKIAHFRRPLGLPYNFNEHWVHKYPDVFRVFKNEDGVEFLKLVSWNPSLSVTEIEKRVMGDTNCENHVPGVLSLPFPVKFPPGYKTMFRHKAKIKQFQTREYLSPYADAKEVKVGSKECFKRAIAVMHELLSFSNEKRLSVEQLTHFRSEFMMPQKLMRIWLKHFWIFYVSVSGRVLNVFLTEAYDGSQLIDKCPLVVWKEKVVRLTKGTGGRNRKILTFEERDDVGNIDSFESDSKDENTMKIDQSFKEEDIASDVEDELIP